MPAAGKAKVVFIRPSSYGGALKFTIHDGAKTIGALSGNSFFTYECEPGPHLFSTSMEDVAMLDANLLADRLYYVKVSAEMGAWIARVNMYSLYPGCAGKFWDVLPKKVGKVGEFLMNPEAIARDEASSAKYMERIQRYHKEKYLTNPKREQILPEHGQTSPVAAQ